MLRSLQSDQWKSSGAATERSRLQLAPLSLLVGPNGGGKSNVLDGLRFLQGAAFD
jgi:predicted ATPase